MNCREAEELFGIYHDLPKNDSRRQALDRHIEQCPACAAEFQIWQESYDLIQAQVEEDKASELIITAEAEKINLTVMDRIYAESPWVLQTDRKHGPILRLFRRRLSAWILCLFAIFVCSSLYLTLDFSGTFDRDAAQERVSGIVPTAIATSDNATVANSSLHFVGSERGLIDPLVIPMSPSHPQYWMILSVVGMMLALLSLRWLAKARHS
ncbi:anti-sigma factor family protein [Paenibacillus kyungheensis]